MIYKVLAVICLSVAYINASLASTAVAVETRERATLGARPRVARNARTYGRAEDEQPGRTAASPSISLADSTCAHTFA